MLTAKDALNIAANVEAMRPQIEAMTSYADAMTAAVKRHGAFEIDGLKFQRRTDIQIPTDYVSTGAHQMVYALEGTGKLYKVTIQPMTETHGGKS
jgi:hypothetical protein